jgi:H+-transporting ATPase
MQVASTLIAAMGFGGYAPPPDNIKPCLLCRDSHLSYPTFWASKAVPVAGTEGRYNASVIGCTYWIIVAWIW